VEHVTAVVTGATSGIGLAAATELARRGARMVLVGRDEARTAAAVATVAAAATGPAPEHFLADFARLDDVRALAERLRAAYPRVDVLANNAGGVVRRRTSTVDGYEATLQINHLAPFLLTNLLRESLRGGRVVTTASDAHTMGGLDPADLTGRGGIYSLWLAYSASKQANILFATEAARRWPDILSVSFHPGVVRTRFGHDTIATVFFRFMPLLRTPEQGADTLVWLATAPAGELTSGGYYERRTLRAPARQAADPALAARLWEASAAAVMGGERDAAGTGGG
jgi:NAD(P)-dependent dehydrogenase (short-subunit alcohol dehydrogenase family)